MHRRFFLLTLCAALLSLPAFAQNDGYVPPNNGAQPGSYAANLDVQLSNIQDQLRQLRGQIEENQFQVKKLTEDLAKLQRDTDFRFNEMTNKPPASPAAPAPAAQLPQQPQEPATPPPPAEEKTTLQKKELPKGLTTGGSGILNAPNAKESDNPVTPRQLYNYAFRLLNQTKYPEAADAFNQFTKKYSNDPLIGNAYYWEGETYYIRHDYVKAADNFRKGFEALPDGPKAADNLLKLAMSLDALNRDKDACTVLESIVTKYRKVSTSVSAKAAQEQKRISCK